MTGRRAALLAVAALLAAGPAVARDAARDRRPERPKPAAGPARPRARPAAAGPELNAVDRETVRAWLAAHPDWTPPGPPAGAPAARPVRGKALPAGVAGEALPPELAMQLPYFPGYRYRALGGDLVLLAKGGGLVAGVLPGALAR
ncbi:hypothetical protein [Roseicella frigidaeris]|uniref:DUF1236 domain-containing protein n=1 Tax=Roseicella frigidaeris TaxID=2230885 RepID=A0A327M8B9_9PROT|nr:hypothetical protein [Roseicella frigidaeris]RAI59170.1 hypothetical protein DOO78_09005 [Roseicella frigidaeris]